MKFIEFMNLAGTVKKKPAFVEGPVLPDGVRDGRRVDRRVPALNDWEDTT